ncbi:penicillin-binding transpeptidase domain-containing protein [Paenibacillus glycanilyticus]|uniref:peptidoglycan D,D-transpeptidase FtsI family protein n=1 Tax=Paenibacillus glycanilyticus TaxID=126569 RepID=UPI00203D5419|nr:penicillin-binding transpeptidase domain-containing protein [Paenibacillus glycanilyticus]MCM3630167.1 penicillin-binding transpeptidase domain-containing protein [Paenibacillus glycanilyticus]
MKRRIAVIGLLFILLLSGFIARLAWLQLTPGYGHKNASTAMSRSSWKRVSVMQRERNLVLDAGRGDFVDRNNKPITGETYYTLALFPVNMELEDPEQQKSWHQNVRRLAVMLKVPEEELVSWWKELREPSFWHKEKDKLPYRLNDQQLTELRQLHLNGVRALPYRNRYLTAFAAKQAIGYISQHPEHLEMAYSKELASGKRKKNELIGGSGLEKSLDDLLHGAGATSVSYFTDGNKKPLFGLDYRITEPGNPYYPLQVQTTLDLELQNRIEAYIDAKPLKEGAVVVLDARNGDIVAMVSRPQMKPLQLDHEKEWANHAIQAAVPGSIFKLVTEAAALEAGVTNEKERFTCNGEYGKYGLSCWKEGGHGTLTLREGLAQSCNIVFATIAERLSAEQLQRTAAALGIGRPAGWHSERAFGPFHHPLRLLEEEEAGRLLPASAEVKTDGGIMAQSAIGQRDVLMSPLQAANLVVTLLNHGRVMEPRLVREIRYANGQRMVSLRAKSAPAQDGRIRPATAHKLLHGMEAVVDHGTGRSIRQGIWAVAGKSGTAEITKAGAPRVNQWFTGYGPAQKPRYAVAVLAENRAPGSSNQATELFRGVMDIIALYTR